MSTNNNNDQLSSQREINHHQFPNIYNPQMNLTIQQIDVSNEDDIQKNCQLFRFAWENYMFATGLNNSPEKLKKSILLLKIGDDCLRLSQQYGFDINKEYATEKETFDEIVKCIKPVYNIRFQRSRFNRAMQYQFNETYDQYLNRLRSIIIKCAFDKHLVDDFLLDKIICSIRDLDLRQELWSCEEITLDRAMQMCNNKEHLINQTKNRNRNNNNGTNTNINDNINDDNNSNGQNQNKRRPRGGRSCDRHQQQRNRNVVENHQQEQQQQQLSQDLSDNQQHYSNRPPYKPKSSYYERSSPPPSYNSLINEANILPTTKKTIENQTAVQQPPPIPETPRTFIPPASIGNINAYSTQRPSNTSTTNRLPQQNFVYVNKPPNPRRQVIRNKHREHNNTNDECVIL